MVRSRSGGFAAVLAILVCLLGGGRALACTGEPVTVAWLADQSAQVVVCEVASIRSYWVGGNRRIESEVTLRDVQYLKGAPDAPPGEVTIVFPGGTVGDVTMRLCCAPDLGVGERFVMFLQPEYRTYPTAGIGQGVLRVEPDAEGVARVHTAQGLPVTGISDQGVPLSASSVVSRRATPRPVGVRGGGIRLHAPEHDVVSREAEPRAMTLGGFVEQITPVLDASRAYDLSGPVVRRVGVDLTAVPLRRAPGAEELTETAAPARDAMPRRVEAPAPREVVGENGGER